MSSTFRWFMAGTVIVGGIIAACSSSDDGKPTGPIMTEVARKQVGAAGGSVSGGGATIEIPEGAVEDGTTIVINQLTATAANLPKSSVLAGAVYSLLPDDVEFKKPVTVRLAIDPSKKPADGKGAIVIFRAPANTNDWTVKGATGVQGNEVVAKTTHFSWWAPAVAGDTSCLHNRCQLDAGTARGMPEFPGMDCVVPNSGGAAVHCKGTGPNASGPYECGCTGTDAVIGNYDHPPTDSEISALATQCGAVCPPTVQIPCTITAVCGAYEAAPGDVPAIQGTTPGWTCKTTTAPYPLKCSHVPGAGNSTCRCDDGTIIPLPSNSPPNEDEMLAFWADNCRGNCNPNFGNQSSSGSVITSDSGPPQDPCIPVLQHIPGQAQCSVGASCYGDTYSADCVAKTGDPSSPVGCNCRMNAGIVKSFDLPSCENITAQELADKCGNFPKPDDAGSGNRPDTGPPPPPPCGYEAPVGDAVGHPNCKGIQFNDPDPSQCSVSATCLGEGYSVDCTRPAQPPSDGGPYLFTCTCKKGGAFVKTVEGVQQCSGGPGGIGDLCGWPADSPPSTCTIPGTAGCTAGEHVVCAPADAGGGGPPMSECQCFKNGAAFKTVTGPCAAPGDPTVGPWIQCGFPDPSAQ